MTRIQSLGRMIAPFALLAMTAACAPTFNAKVNRFQAMPAPQGQSFAVVAGDPKLEGSLEFAQYARLVGDKLAAQGYQPATNVGDASIIVKLAYGVDEGKERTRIVPGGYSGRYGAYDPWWGYAGYYGGRWPSHYRRGHYGYAYGWHDPFLFGSGWDDVEEYTVFTTGLDMKIERKGSGERLFEGKAQAMSLSNNLTYLVPNLVEAMFTGFPGNSGETVKITVKPQPKKG